MREPALWGRAALLEIRDPGKSSEDIDISQNQKVKFPVNVALDELNIYVALCVEGVWQGEGAGTQKSKDGDQQELGGYSREEAAEPEGRSQESSKDFEALEFLECSLVCA